MVNTFLISQKIQKLANKRNDEVVNKFLDFLLNKNKYKCDDNDIRWDLIDKYSFLKYPNDVGILTDAELKFIVERIADSISLNNNYTNSTKPLDLKVILISIKNYIKKNYHTLSSPFDNNMISYCDYLIKYIETEIILTDPNDDNYSWDLQKHMEYKNNDIRTQRELNWDNLPCQTKKGSYF